MLLKWGYDEFEEFPVHVTIHSVKDVKDAALFGKAKLKVQVEFWYNNWTTNTSTDFRFEKSKKMTVPQGADTCKIILQCEKIHKNATLGTCKLDISKHMLLKGPEWWGKKHALKLQHGGNVAGQVYVTFRRLDGQTGPMKQGADRDLEAGSNPEEEPLLAGGNAGGTSNHGSYAAAGGPAEDLGDDEDGALFVEMAEKARELGMPNVPKDMQNRMWILGELLEGELKECTARGKEKDTFYYHVCYCNYAEIQDEDERQDEWRRQMAKARKKGLAQPEKKWYLCWYESKKAYNKRWNDVEGYIPLLSITSVHRDPKNDGIFSLRYTDGGDKTEAYLKRMKKPRDVWVDGIEMLRKYARQTKA
jgi:hypothetical protein